MNLQQLYYFKTIAELEHYTQAAQKLNISQSSLSHSITDLEKELGVSLFIRQGRNVRLTRCEAFFLEYVSQSLEILDEGRSRLQDFISPETGSIALSYLSSLSGFVPYLIARFFESRGKVQNRFRFDQLASHTIEEFLVTGKTDLAFTTPFDNPEITSVKIGSHKTVLVVPKDHPLASQESVNLKNLDLEGETFITYHPQCQIRSYMEQVFQSVGLRPRIAFEAFHDSIILGAVAAHLGIALMPEASADVSTYNTAVVPLENDLPTRDIHLAWGKGRYMTPAVKNFRDFVLESGQLLDDYKAFRRTETGGRT